MDELMVTTLAGQIVMAVAVASGGEPARPGFAWLMGPAGSFLARHIARSHCGHLPAPGVRCYE